MQPEPVHRFGLIEKSTAGNFRPIELVNTREDKSTSEFVVIMIQEASPNADGGFGRFSSKYR